MLDPLPSVLNKDYNACPAVFVPLKLYNCTNALTWQIFIAHLNVVNNDAAPLIHRVIH
jgi:hypothetical protein